MPGRKEVRGGAGALTLASGISAVSASLQGNGSVTGWPTGASFPFVITLDRLGPKTERMLCSALSGVGPCTITILTRGYDGTTAQTHDPGEIIEHVLDADSIDSLFAHNFDTSRDDHTQYTKVDGTRGFSAVTAIAGSPVAIGSAATAPGSALTLARSDHVHGLDTRTNALVVQDATARQIVAMARPNNSALLQTVTSFTDLGNTASITVPSWATKAIVTTRWIDLKVGANGAQWTIQTVLGATAGTPRSLFSNAALGGNTINPWASYVDTFTGLSAGAITIKTQAKGSGIGGGGAVINFDAAESNGVEFDVEFLP